MNYFIGSLYGDYEGYLKIKETLKLKNNDKLWILGDAVDSSISPPESSIKIIEDIEASDNIELLVGDHEFFHLMRIVSRNDKISYDYWLRLLGNLEVSGEDLVEYFMENGEEGIQDEFFDFVISECEISRLIRIGDNYFYLVHGFPCEFDETSENALTRWQNALVTGTISDTDYIRMIKSDISISDELKLNLRYDNTFVICSHQNINTVSSGANGVYHKKGIFLIGENRPEEQIPILAIDAGGYFFQILRY